jgi:hypothetical protein
VRTILRPELPPFDERDAQRFEVAWPDVPGDCMRSRIRRAASRRALTRTPAPVTSMYEDGLALTTPGTDSRRAMTLAW